ncbi:Pseudouridine-5'-monophosphatase [Tritrichomonas foetus]|uniref:Pseudouridine-5'-monophosphatase n=1 Tax=Tritrichomonas foetus TaxID=1144522 RepID=A0A1J4JJM0_9EUKA|nr:Pseudouridine-5'-monophosphatase [Tritrichomonas foetus]|eukprot:OHS98543.1 Pseudouridine-5'-monophosphatase [Tritrichomonas foetus]
MYPHRIKAVIFDNDGTLVDSEEAYSKAHHISTGQPLTWDLKVRLMGKTLLEACQITVDECHLDETAEHYGERFEKVLDGLMPNLNLMPGVMEMLKILKSKGVRMCIATASTERSFKKKVAGHPEMIEMMDHCFTGDQVAHGKPAPDLFLKALHEWNGIKPEEALVFEDSPLGIKAANNAGIPAVFVPDPNLNQEEALKKLDAKPLMTIESLEKFDYSLFSWGF